MIIVQTKATVMFTVQTRNVVRHPFKMTFATEMGVAKRYRLAPVCPLLERPSTARRGTSIKSMKKSTENTSDTLVELHRREATEKSIFEVVKNVFKKTQLTKEPKQVPILCPNTVSTLTFLTC